MIMMTLAFEVARRTRPSHLLQQPDDAFA